MLIVLLSRFLPPVVAVDAATKEESVALREFDIPRMVKEAYNSAAVETISDINSEDYVRNVRMMFD